MKIALSFYCLKEHFCGLESGNVVFGDNNRRVLGDVAGGLFCALLEDEAAEAAEIHVLVLREGILDLIHEGLNNGEGCSLVNTGLF